MSWALRFLGVGNACAVELGSASAVVECDGRPLLMIDCGQEALTAYLQRYGGPPEALFITHAHLDHVAAMERLFVECYFDPGRRGRTRVFVPAPVIETLHMRVGSYPDVLAEGGANFWDAFQLVPVGDGFWQGGHWFDVFAVRHHRPRTAYGIGLRGSLVYSGDTRPVPEVLAGHGDAGELIAHDCALEGNPSHSGLDDLEREYPADVLARLVLYHYGSVDEADAMRARGYRVAVPGAVFELPAPHSRRSRPC